ncbi:MAG: DUF6471 domain-containing protein [Hyphomonadaceae bacterium]
MRSFAKDHAEWSKRVTAYLKVRVEDAGLTYAEFAERLERYGYPNETPEGLKQKMYRGRLSAAFFLAALAALGETRLVLKDV